MPPRTQNQDHQLGDQTQTPNQHQIDPVPRRQRNPTPPTSHLGKPQKNTRANIRIGSLNIQGRGSRSLFDPNNKWNKINQFVKEENIAILAVQEAHLDTEMTDQINDLYYNLSVHASPDPENTNARGVAFVINQRIAAVGSNIKITTIIPGRAMLLETKWHNDDVLVILNIYAPNNMRESKTFWGTLQEAWCNPESNLAFPDIMLGDYNITEHPLDRCNGKWDNTETVKSLQNLTEAFQMKDGWRETNPNTVDYTLLHNSNQHQSRIDRIYTTSNQYDRAHDWKLEDSPIPTDHRLTSVNLSTPNTPYIGKGRWSIPNFSLGSRKFLQKIEEDGKNLLDKLGTYTPTNRTDTDNPQLIWSKFKTETINIAREFAKKTTSQIDRQLKEIEAEIRATNADSCLLTLDKRVKVKGLAKQKKEILTRRFQTKRDVTAARNHLEGETVCKYWTSLQKQKTTRDLIRKLKIPNSEGTGEQIFEKRSDKMAEIARRHHDSLQDLDTDTDPTIRETAINEALDAIPNGISEEEKTEMDNPISEDLILNALASGANGRAPGLDGIPYELWKILHKRCQDLRNEDKEGFDIIKTLCIVFNDIEKYGTHPETNFSEGWMCPIYKKGEKTEIANFRPITVLNTDYKLMAKSLQARLAEVAQNIIHHNQAGFMKGRSIINHIHTMSLMTDYAELSSTNEGAIIALDQEKAYDKISHDYLLRALKRFNLPESFIRTVESLYKHAETRVMINGVLSEKFQVRRGVRQGDPLSCLLFNLAIEPLACLIRNSKLRGAKIPNLHDDLKVLMFADDTTVFLYKEDKYSDLVQILDNWCLASRAKFNITKTEVIPLGSQAYRNIFIETRHLSESQNPIPEGTRITRDGEKVRILGAWIGNGGDENRPWENIKKRTIERLDRWNRTKPGTEGRRHAIQMTVHGLTQYLTQAQGMPEKIEKDLIKMTSNFLWKGSKARINLDTMADPHEIGGRKVPHLKRRNTAIKTKNLQALLTDNTSPWPKIAHEIYKILSPSNKTYSGESEIDPRTNIFIQTWTATSNKNSKLPRILRECLKAAREVNLSLDAHFISNKIRRLMPIWLHPYTAANTKNKTNLQSAKHLRNVHNTQTVGDAETLAKRLSSNNHSPNRNCDCAECTFDKEELDCHNPHKCARLAETLLGNLQLDWNPKGHPEAPHNTTPIALSRNSLQFRNTDIPQSIEDAFRINPGKPPPQSSVTHEPEDMELDEESIAPIEISIAGYCKNQNLNTAKAGSAITYNQNDHRNRGKRTQGPQTKLNAELVAVIMALENTNFQIPLTIQTSSPKLAKYLTKGFKKDEDNGWSYCAHSTTVKKIITLLRKREATVIFRTLDPAICPPEIAFALSLARQGAEKPNIDPKGDSLALDYHPIGAKLAATSQAEIYKLLTLTNKPKRSKTAIENIQKIRSDLEAKYGKSPEPEVIWTNLRKNRNVARKHREFLYAATRGTYRIGKFWEHSNSEEIKQRQLCPRCETIESMEHILCDCQIPGQAQIWSMTQKIWNATDLQWTKPTFGEILGTSSTEIMNSLGKKDDGRSRLLQILTSEAAYTIWRLRCTRVLDHENNPSHWPTNPEIENTLKHNINNRLKMDRIQTCAQKFDKKALRADLVTGTWNGLLENIPPNSIDWIDKNEVLVGNRFFNVRQPAEPGAPHNRA